MRSLLVFTLAILYVFYVSMAWASEKVGVATVDLLDHGPGRGITELSWLGTGEISVTREADEFYVTLRARYGRVGWTVSALPEGSNSQMIFLGKKTDDVDLHLKLSGEKTRMQVLAQGPGHAEESERIIINFPAFGAAGHSPTALAQTDKVARHHHWRAALGVDFNSATQTAAANDSETSLVFLLGFEKVFSAVPRLDFKLDASLTGVDFKHTLPDVQAHYFFGALNVGYAVLGDPHATWRLALRAGLAYRDMWVSSDQFGYRNVYGPELYPELEHQLNRRSSLSMRVKFSPFMDHFSFMPIGNHEISAGLAYHYLASEDQILSLFTEWSQLNFAQDALLFQSNHFEIGVGYEY